MRFSSQDFSSNGHGSSGIYFVLFLMFLAALSILLERWLQFRRMEPEEAVEAAGLDRLARGFGFELQRSAMEIAIRSTRQEMSRGLRSLLTLAITLPLVGLLETLSGTINAFRALALTGSGGFSAIAMGLAEALVPTAVGLALGLVAFWSHAYLHTWLDRLTSRMTRHANVSLERWRGGRVAG